jgi:hypothetical protein
VHGGPGEVAAEAIEGLSYPQVTGDDSVVAIVHQHESGGSVGDTKASLLVE